MRQRVTIPISKDRLNPSAAEELVRKLELMPGVYSVYIGLQTEMAHIVYDLNVVDLPSLRRMIEDEG